MEGGPGQCSHQQTWRALRAMFGNAKKAPLQLPFSDCYIILIERPLVTQLLPSLFADTGEDKLWKSVSTTDDGNLKASYDS